MLFTANASGLSVNGNTIDIADMQSGPYTIQEMQIYLQSTNEPVNIVSAEQNDKTIDIVLSSDTDLSAKIQAVLSGSGNGEMIDGATEESFTPATDEIGTTYYYATASFEGLAVTSNIAAITVTEIPTLNVTDNVIDITDKTVYSRSSYYAKAVNIKIDGATVEKATEDGETVNIVLDGFTNPSAEISVEFGTSLNRCTMIGHTGTVKLNNGEAEFVMTLTGQYISSLKGSCTYTLRFSLGEAPEMLPERKIESDNKETYNGVKAEFDLNDYFNFAKSFYLLGNSKKTPIESNIYTFITHEDGTHTLVFGASNDTGDCPDYVTSNVYTTCTISYALENNIPVLSEGCEKSATAEIIAGESFTLDQGINFRNKPFISSWQKYLLSSVQDLFYRIHPF